MKTANQIREQILDRATLDTDFRERFKADPVSTLKNEFGLSVPDGFHVNVHEDDARNTHIVLPPSPELSESELSIVSAGDGDSHYYWDS